MTDLTADNRAEQKSPRVGLAVIVVLVGMIGIQFGQKYFQLTVKSQAPGIERGDMPLTESSLPAVVGEWQQVKFLPPGDAPEGQFWWSHSWHYRTDDVQAIVSYDQADWNGWHELSECYSATGWTLKSRDIEREESSDWDYVVSTFTKGNAHATLVFSLFFDDGDMVAPWQLSLKQAVKQDMSTMDLLMDRRRHATDRADARAFQCQVFVPSQHKTGANVRAEAVSLHLQSRKQLREHWLEYHRNKTPKK